MNAQKVKTSGVENERNKEKNDARVKILLMEGGHL